MNKKYISILLLLIVLLITLTLGSYNFVQKNKSDKSATLPSIIQTDDIPSASESIITNPMTMNK